MSNIWDYRSGIAPSTQSMVGYDVEATDGHIGKIDEASVVSGQAHLVVDTGFWIFGKKRMIPAGVVESVDHDAETVRVSLTKDEVKAAPDFDAQRRDERDELDTYYEPFGR